MGRHVKLGDSWEMLVCLADVRGEHWTRNALSTYNFMLNNARLHRSDRESLLASQPRIEEPFDCFVGVVGELFGGAQCCNDDGRDNTLGVAHSSRKSTVKFTGGQASNMTNDQILNQLGKPDKRK